MLAETIWLQIYGMARARDIEVPDMPLGELLKVREQKPYVTDPDGLERLWQPHRMTYVTTASDEPAADPDLPACPFCRITPDPDDVAR